MTGLPGLNYSHFDESTFCCLTGGTRLTYVLLTSQALISWVNGGRGIYLLCPLIKLTWHGCYLAMNGCIAKWLVVGRLLCGSEVS